MSIASALKAVGRAGRTGSEKVLRNPFKVAKGTAATGAGYAAWDIGSGYTGAMEADAETNLTDAEAREQILSGDVELSQQDMWALNTVSQDSGDDDDDHTSLTDALTDWATSNPIEAVFALVIAAIILRVILSGLGGGGGTTVVRGGDGGAN